MINVQIPIVGEKSIDVHGDQTEGESHTSEQKKRIIVTQFSLRK